MKGTLHDALAVAFAVALLLAPMRAQALQNEDILAVVAMPLAVAAVTEVPHVPVDQFVDVVTLLNDAAVAPPQFIEVVRYVPAALVVETPAQGPNFLDYVRLRESEGLRGPALVTSIEDRLRAYDVDVVKLTVERPRVIDIGDDYIPSQVRTRIDEARKEQ